jgi:hypothetical protein
MSMGGLESELEDLYRRRNGAFQVMLAAVTGSVDETSLFEAQSARTVLKVCQPRPDPAVSCNDRSPPCPARLTQRGCAENGLFTGFFSIARASECCPFAGRQRSAPM